MIHSLSIKNYLSFKDEVTFSFEATNDKKLEEYHVVEVAPGIRLLKLGVVYGANASGKSNLLYAFEFLKDCWELIPKNKDELTHTIPFLLDEKIINKPSYFKLVFYINKIRYIYHLEINKTRIIKESLIFYPGSQPAIIFERKFNNNVSEIEFGSKIKISSLAKEEITLKCLPNMSVFAAYSQVNINIPEFITVLDWLHNGYMLSIDPGVNLVEYAEATMINNPDITNEILAFLQKADFNISATQFKEKKHEFIPEKIREIDVQDDGILIIGDGIKVTEEVEFIHKIVNSENKTRYYSLPKDLQSAGTLRVLGISSAIIQAVQNNSFLSIDEIESKLHPRLIEFVIETFLKQSQQAQLLVTTHYDGLLEEEDLLRKDNIWFTEKKENGSTELYSLSDFKAINRITSLQKAYKYGKFGAIPNID